MSTTLSTTAMAAMLQAKTGIGLSSALCLDRLNEAFRKINQMSKGGFIWQLQQTSLVWTTGNVVTSLPADFDPGKTAILRGNGTDTPTNTEIPYVPYKEFVNEAHYQTTQPGFVSAWSFYPSFISAPSSYAWKAIIGPPDAAFTAPTTTLPFTYHSVSYAPVALGPGNFFPTPDQFDSLIVDLAWAEVEDIYRGSDADKIRARAMQGIMEIIDTYRSDRYDLAGITDQVAQAAEKNAENAR